MSPTEQQQALARCLAIAEKIGWPEWIHDDTRWRLRHCDGDLCLRECMTQDGHWAIATGEPHHVSLCIWQHHLIERLAAVPYMGGMEINNERGDGWYPSFFALDGQHMSMSCHSQPHLIFALLEATENILKEEEDEPR